MNNLLEQTASETVADARFRWRPEFLKRVRDSLKTPSLVGKTGARVRYLRVQWWVVFWRVLIILQIPETMLVQPDLFHSSQRASALLVVGGGYAAVYYLFATRTRASGKAWLHLADLGVCSALLLLAGDDKLLFIMSFYSYSCLLTRPTVLLREMLPATFAISLVYLGAYWQAGYSPLNLFSNHRELDGFVEYFFWGLGFVGFSAVLKRASSLELDSYLEDQRRSYRRRLHDDLGNTLCGLHFRIQSLRQISPSPELGGALRFLADGYDRANRVLIRLLSGLDDKPVDDLSGSLAHMKRELAQGGGPVLHLVLPAAPVKLSPEVGREVLAVVGEAVSNAIKHSNISEICVMVKKRFGRLTLTVADEGGGFDDGELRARQSAGSKGIKGMYERAALIKGRLQVESGRGRGTVVTLTVDLNRGNGLLSRILDYDPERSLSGIYPLVVRLRFFMLVWTLIDLALRPVSHSWNLPLFVLTVWLIIDCLAWVFFQSALHRIIGKHPGLLVFETAGFIGLSIGLMQAGLPFFIPLYLGVAVIMNGMFLDVLGNLALTIFLDAGIIAAFAWAPAAALAGQAGSKYEMAMQHSTIYVILAVSAGLAGEFVKNMESLQLSAIDRALARQRENMTAETHRKLHSLVTGLGSEFNYLAAESRSLDSQKLSSIVSRSNYLKTRLRSILDSLDEPVEPGGLTGDSGLTS